MSHQPATPIRRRLSASDIRNLKGKAPVVCLTAYTAPVARLLDEHVDLLMVGDSLGMVLYGLDSTLPVSLDMMIAHGAAVVRSSRTACVVVDMPFGSYQQSPEQAFANCARVMKETGCQAVKLEGGKEMSETIAFLVARGIPVMGHVALTPQSINTLGSYRFRGRTTEERKAIMEDAVAVAQAGAFAIVVEGVEMSLGREITEAVKAAVIGIGASADCDGQVLVTEDMLGQTPFQPKFVKKYAGLADTIAKAAADYASDVRARSFPSPDYCYQEKK